jgi:serine/threonine protein kinase
MSPKVSGLAAIRFPLISASDVTALPHFAEFRGGNGVVRQVMYHGNLAAMKKPNVTLTLNARDRSKFVKELEITYAVKHTACVQMLGACLEGDLFLLLEWMEGGSLYDALGNHADRPVLPRVRLSIARNVADGLEYLHSRGIVHRDIKSLNILLTSDMRAKLCDFGLATLQTLTASARTTTGGGGAAGTYPYFAPELFHGAKSSEKSDIYAFGVVLWELLTCDVPFDTLTETQVRGLLERGERPVIPEPLPSCFPPEYVHLIRRCWHQDPAARPTAQEALAALVGMDPRSHINGPVQLYPDGHSIPPFSTLLSLLTTAMPGAAAQPLLQQMTQYVTDVLAKGKEFVDATRTHGLMPLEAHCIAAYTLDARCFSCPREDSPFFVCAHSSTSLFFVAS